MRESIGYKTLDIRTCSELEKIQMEDSSIELLCGSARTGKTVALINYFNRLQTDCILLSNFMQKDIKEVEYNDYTGALKQSKIINPNDILNLDIEDLEFLNDSKCAINLLDLCYIDENVKTTVFTKLINYCNDNNTLLIFDFPEETERLISLLNKEISFPIIITCGTSIDLTTKLKEKVNMPIEHTFMNFKRIDKLNELECKHNIDNCSGSISLRVPRSLHSDLILEASAEGISLNQYLLYIISSRQV